MNEKKATPLLKISIEAFSRSFPGICATELCYYTALFKFLRTNFKPTTIIPYTQRMLKMLLLTVKDFLEDVFQIYRRRFSIWDAVGLSAAVLFVTLMGYPLWIVGSIFLLSIMCHSFLDEFYAINGGDIRFVEMGKKMRIWRIVFDVWNLTCAIWIGGFSGKTLGDFLNSFLTDVYWLMLITNGWGEE